MDEVVGNVLLGSLNGTMRSGATLVPGQAGNGLYFSDGESRVEYGSHHSHCFHDPDVCSQGFTTTIWMKRGQATTDGHLMGNGADYNTAKGKLWVPIQYKDVFISVWEIHYEDMTAVRSFYLHKGVSYTDKMSSLYWIRAMVTTECTTVCIFSRPVRLQLILLLLQTMIIFCVY